MSTPPPNQGNQPFSGDHWNEYPKSYGEGQLYGEASGEWQQQYGQEPSQSHNYGQQYGQQYDYGQQQTFDQQSYGQQQSYGEHQSYDQNYGDNYGQQAPGAQHQHQTAAQPAAYDGQYASQPTDVSAQKPKGRGRLIVLLSVGLVLLLAIGGLVAWEFIARGQAADKYAALLEGQEATINTENGTFPTSGEFAGGFAVTEQLGGTFSNIRLSTDPTALNTSGMHFDYDLIGAPANGQGTIKKVIVTATFNEEFFVDTAHIVSASFTDMTVKVTNGEMQYVGTYDGQPLEWNYTISAQDGWIVFTDTHMILNGQDLLATSNGTEMSSKDWCEEEGLSSYMSDVQINEGSVTLTWEISNLGVEDLALASCIS